MRRIVRADGIWHSYRLKKTRRRSAHRQALDEAARQDGALLWALRDISFSAYEGETLGIVGVNGAGKSTLLRIIGGVLEPDRGRISVGGRVGTILELGSGFHPDLTGRENILINGVIAGHTRKEIKRRFDEIVGFSELGELIENPLRTYSSGMQMRLAFSIAVHVEADLLLIDEILAVGDLAFKKKCFDRLDAFRRAGCTTILVAHEAQIMRRLCDRVLWIDGGKLQRSGPAEEVLDAYIAFFTSNQPTPPSPAPPA